ncbi:MAG: patatin-like phospholipase family protein [Holosporaceae bacterium]|nr:patatin-like phospholipase family protein [Holosporaceae bacterium]
MDCVLEPRKSIAYDRDTIDMFNHMLPFNSSNSVASRIIAGGSELASRTMSPIPFDYKNKIILALHGGGSRGYVAYSIIKSLRNDLKLDKKEILPVDMIAGVSVGALVGGVEALGLTEVFDFRKTSRSFFVPNEEYCLWHCIKKLINAIPVVNWLSSPLSFIDYHLSIQNMIRKTPFVNSLCFGSIPFLRGYLFPKYSSSAKFRAIENIFGDNTLADLKTHFCVPVADTQNKELRIIDSAGNPDLLLKDVLQATTAAPTFFNPHCFVTRDVLTEFADGGIVDNNPSDIAFCQAKTKFPHSNIKIISIGNGEGSIDAASPSWKSRNLMFYGNTLPLYMMATSSNKTSNMMSAISKSDPHVEYIEISPTFDENLIKMDMTDDAFFEKISNNALKSCSTNCSYAYNTAKQLLQNARTSVVNGYML